MFVGKDNFRLGSDVRPHTMVAAGGRDALLAGTPGQQRVPQLPCSDAAAWHVPVGELLCPPHATGQAHMARDTSLGTLNSGVCCRGRSWTGISFIVGRWPV